jgi:hypothetical protein
MSLLRIKQADGSWTNIPAIKGADGIDGKDGAVQYTAGRYIQIDEDTQTINCTVKIGDLVIIDAVPVKDSTNVVSSGGVYDALETKADKTEIAGLGSEAGFITNSVEDLKNYYKKSETYSQEEVNSLIGNLTRLTLQVVQELPEVGTEHIIYLVPNNESGNNIYEEWIFVQSKWEMIGTTEVDLSNYYTKEEIDNMLQTISDSAAGYPEYPWPMVVVTGSLINDNGSASSPRNYSNTSTVGKAMLEEMNKLYSQGVRLMVVRLLTPDQLHIGYIDCIVDVNGQYSTYQEVKLPKYFSDTQYILPTMQVKTEVVNGVIQRRSNSSTVLTVYNWTIDAYYDMATKTYVNDTIQAAIKTALEGEY